MPRPAATLYPEASKQARVFAASFLGRGRELASQRQLCDPERTENLEWRCRLGAALPRVSGTAQSDSAVSWRVMIVLLADRARHPLTCCLRSR